MSGIVGLVQFDQSPVDRRLLQQLTDSLTFRGPDAQRIWTNHNVGFGHTLFKTTDESERDCQPLTLDGEAWIVADARIDARDHLFAALKAAGEADLERSDCTDAELILRAYRCWGPNCVKRLLGDFAFGIWDNSRQQLLCARDRMGVRPFYFARLGSLLIFSNTLDCIRRHPLVSNRLNDLAIADFLLFGCNQDAASTSFAEIQRLPPAHRAIWSGNNLQLSRYWAMPIDEPIFYAQPDDYTDRFLELLRQVVGDRLRTNQVSIFLSGGLDSPTIAVAARDLLRERYPSFQLRALTEVDAFVPDEERYAGVVAAHLGIPIDYSHWTDVSDFRWERIPFGVPEPCPGACLVPSQRKFWSQLGNYSRIFLNGEGPDNALFLDWRAYIAYLAKHKRYGLLARSVLATIMSEKYPPFWGRLSRKLTVAGYRANAPQPSYPAWLSRRLEARYQLPERWRRLNSPEPPLHPIRPQGYASLQIPRWQAMFEGLDFGATKCSFEVSHPFVDIRMLRFLLAVPPLPWCRSKYLLRKSMDGSLPKAVLRRKKTTPDMRLFRVFLAKFCQARFEPAPDIQDFIDFERFSDWRRLPDNPEGDIRLRSLNHWLQNSYRSSHTLDRVSRCDRVARQTATIAERSAQEALPIAQTRGLRRFAKTD